MTSVQHYFTEIGLGMCPPGGEESVCGVRNRHQFGTMIYDPQTSYILTRDLYP